MTSRTQLHATCVSVGGKGVLLLGDPGSGKSDLALRLIDSGAQLVADDRVDISLSSSPHAGEGKYLIASPPEKLRGLIEARGIGILTLSYAESVPLAVAIQLVERAKMERLPEPEFLSCLGMQLPLHSLHAFDASTPAKIRLLLCTKE